MARIMFLIASNASSCLFSCMNMTFFSVNVHSGPPDTSESFGMNRDEYLTHPRRRGITSV